MSSIPPPLTALPKGCFLSPHSPLLSQGNCWPSNLRIHQVGPFCFRDLSPSGPSGGSASWNGLQSYSVGSGRILRQLLLTNPSTVFYGLPKGWKVNKTEKSALLLSWMSVWTRVARPAVSWHSMLKATAPHPNPPSALQPSLS